MKELYIIHDVCISQIYSVIERLNGYYHPRINEVYRATMLSLNRRKVDAMHLNWQIGNKTSHNLYITIATNIVYDDRPF